MAEKLLSRVKAVLPKGTGLPEPVWRVRHSFFVLLLWVHVGLLPFFAWIFGRSLLDGLTAAAIVAVLASGASLRTGRHRVQAVLVSIGLATASGFVVHLSGGYIEFHFHYFVVATLLVLYQDWAPFLTMVGFVALQHGLLGILHPHSVYNHPAAIASPWKWAALHAFYIGAACLGAIVAWRKTEEDNEALRAANDRLQEEVQRRRAVEQALQQARAGLEALVQERTGELVNANEALRAETADRRRAEASLREALAELQEKQGQLLQTAKLASIGELASGIAHELNNPLNNISLFLGNLLDGLHAEGADAERASRQLQQALQQVHKASAIIQGLRKFSRASTSEKEPVWINQVIDAALGLVDEQLRLDNITVIKDLAEDPVILGNAIHLEQVLINLFTNAKDALEEVEEKRLTIRSVRDRGRVVLTVQDSGVGISPDQLSRVFDPFFTTKPVGKGTGLGLSVSYGIITEHGGTITVESSASMGTTFRIRLPEAEIAQVADSPQSFFRVNQ